MAESVARVKIQAVVDGLQGFDQFTGAIKKLQGAIGPADSTLEKARRNIIAFGQANKQSAASIDAQIGALKALRQQAGVGGEAFRLINRDISRLTVSMDEVGKATKRVSGILTTSIPAKTPEGIQKQINGLRQLAEEADYMSDRYVAAISRIRGLERLGGNMSGREGVLAGFNAANDQQLQNFGNRYLNNIDLPNTNAALAQRIQEVTDRLSNLTRGSAEWRQSANELKRLTRESAEGFKFMGAGAAQAKARLEEMRRTMRATGSGFADWSRNPTALTDAAAADAAIQKSIERNRRKQGILGSSLYDAPIGPPQPSELFRGIAGISGQQAANQAQMMGRSYNEVAASIRRATAASDGSINSLQSQRASWEALRNAVGSNKAAYREISAEIAKVDRQLEKRGVGGNRGGAAQIGQGLGAVAASGIFGGPEGFLGSAGGAAIGAVLGGPAGLATGAFIGGSAGAYAGMARQGLAGMSNYAADIQKQEIALKGITKTQEEYTRALAAAAGVTRDFNVPQLEATKGITQLSAAVIGAGGKVADAEVVFRNVTAAIKASGGTSEDVQGALTALGQIFSKGKVSAEELQGQLGERLPGAVTMFAKATGRTLPQLQKDLEQGVVGLADLMKFVVSEQGLGQFEQRAKTVAQSSADAGARLVTTWNNTRRAIGEALLPLSAQIQDSLAKALSDATPALVSFAQAVAKAIKLLADNAGVIISTITTVGKIAVVFGGASIAVKAFSTIMGLANQGLALLGAAFGTTTAQAVVAQSKLAAFGTTVRTIARSLAAPIVITVAIVGAQLVIDYFNRIKAAKDKLVQTASEATGMQWLKDIGGDALDKERLAKAVSEVGKAYEQASDKARALRKQRDQLEKDAPFQLGPNAVRAAAQLNEIEAQLKLAEAQEKLLESRYKAGIARLPKAPTATDPLKGLTDFSGVSGKSDLDRDALDKLAREKQQLDESLAKAEIQLSDTVFQHQIELIKKRYDYEEERIRLQRDVWAGTFEGAQSESARAANAFVNRLDDLRKRARLAALDAMQAQQQVASARQMEAVTSQGLGGASSGRGGRVIEYLTGDKSSAAYRADHGGSNYHEHLAFETAKQMRAAMEALKAAGIKIGSTTGGRHASGSYHYRGLAFDVPASQVPVGQEQALSRKVREVLAASGFSGAGIGRKGLGPQIRRDVRAEGQVGIATANSAQAGRFAEMEKNQVAGLMGNEAARYAQERTQSLRDEAKAMEDGNVIVRERMKLEAEGLRPELLEARLKVLQIEQQRADKIEQINRNIAQYQNDPEAVAGFRAELEDTNAAYDRQIAAVNALAQAQTAAGAALSGRIGQLRAELQELANFENILVNISRVMETEISNAISTAVSGLITGSQTIKQTLSQVFANIGQAFLKMAADIIAKQVVMITLQTILKSLGAISGGGAGAAGGTSFTQGSSITSFAKFEKGGVMTSRGPVPLRKYSNGGIANSPQLALFGEGSKPEAYVPLPDGRRIPVAMQEPANSNGRMRDLMGNSPAQASASPVLNMSFETTSIGGVEYVSRDQLEAAMAETRRAAARDGAKRGMTMTLDKLQQSPSTRSRVGLR